MQVLLELVLYPRCFSFPQSVLFPVILSGFPFASLHFLFHVWFVLGTSAEISVTSLS